jgi:hypothetical protein
MMLAVLLAVQLTADTVAAQEEDLAKRLLQAAEVLQTGSEADSFWWFVSYPGEEELPTAERMASLLY